MPLAGLTVPTNLLLEILSMDTVYRGNYAERWMFVVAFRIALPHPGKFNYTPHSESDGEMSPVRTTPQPGSSA